MKITVDLCAEKTAPVVEVRFTMVTFMILAVILIAIALIVGIVLLITLAASGVVGGVLLFLFGDLIIGTIMMIALIKKIIKKNK